MAARAKVLVALHSFEAEVASKLVNVHAGQRVRSTDPVVKGREAFFEETKDVDVEHKPRARRRGKAA